MILTALLLTTAATALPPRDVIAYVDPAKQSLEISVDEYQFARTVAEKGRPKVQEYSIPWTVKSSFDWNVGPSISPTSRIILGLFSDPLNSYSLWFNSETGVSRVLPEDFVYGIIWSSDGCSASGVNSNGNVIVVDADGNSKTLDVTATRVVAFKDNKIFAYRKKDGAKPIFFICHLTSDNKVEAIGGSEWVNQMVGAKIERADRAASVLANNGTFWQGVIVSDLRQYTMFSSGEVQPQTFIFTPKGNFEVAGNRQVSAINILENGNIAFEVSSSPPEQFNRKEFLEFVIFDWKKREGFAFQEWDTGTFFPIGSSLSTKYAEKLSDSFLKDIILPVDRPK